MTAHQFAAQSGTRPIAKHDAGDSPMMARKIAWLALFGLLCALRAEAATDAEKCESTKHKLVGKYTFCRQAAESKAISRGTAPDFSRCDASYSSKWAKAELKAVGACPTNGDHAPMQSYIASHTNALAAALAGAGLPSCGDDTVNVIGELCDGSDLGGATCASLGFSGGTLACSGCTFDTSLCVVTVAFPAAPLATSQTTCHDTDGLTVACAGSGQDGELQKGVPRGYFIDTTVPEERTVIDFRTGLEWEVLCDEDPPGATCPDDHDMDTYYTWTDAFTKITAMNAAGYGGHNDWRLPNINELTTLQKYQLTGDTSQPGIDLTAFHDACTAPCSSGVCSCTQPYYYWSSTPYHPFPFAAWCVYFGQHAVQATNKDHTLHVRAVRDAS